MGFGSACYFALVIFSLVLCLTPFTSSGVFVIIIYFFAARSFSSVDHIALKGGAARQIVSSIFFFYFLRFLLWFLHFIKCVGRACRIQYDDTALHFALLSLLHTWYMAT